MGSDRTIPLGHLSIITHLQIITFSIIHRTFIAIVLKYSKVNVIVSLKYKTVAITEIAKKHSYCYLIFYEGEQEHQLVHNCILNKVKTKCLL